MVDQGKHFSISVFGKVQGVFFRASTKNKAHELNIKGFVSNQNDGSVYIEAEGDPKNLQKFINWCKKGPQNARVDFVQIKESSLIKYNDFNIK